MATRTTLRQAQGKRPTKAKRAAMSEAERQLRDQVHGVVAQILDGRSSRDGPPFPGVERELDSLVAWVRREASP